jgi:hypothetical protein
MGPESSLPFLAEPATGPYTTKILYTFLISYKRATCPAQLVFLNLIILIILGEEHKLAYGALHYAIFSSLPTLYPP